MNIKKSPCYKCEFRTVGCHEKCEPYKEWAHYQHDVKFHLNIKNNPPGSQYFKARMTETGVSESKKRYR